MKTSWIIWWIVTVFWIITFAGMSLAILIRKVDGSGMVQSPEARMYALIVLLIGKTRGKLYRFHKTKF